MSGYTQSIVSGSWTPTVGGNATYLAQDSTYTKIGNQVFVRCHVTINAIGTGSTGVISGLPFPANGVQAGSVGFFANSATNYVKVGCYANGSTIELTGLTAAGATMTDPAVFFGNNAQIYLTVAYTV